MNKKGASPAAGIHEEPVTTGYFRSVNVSDVRRSSKRGGDSSVYTIHASLP